MNPDLDVIRSLTIVALREFQQRVRSKAIQEYGCAHFVQWVATFMPEAFDEILRGRLSDYLLEQKALEQEAWFEFAPLHAAMFSLTGNFDWLDILTRNWDNENSCVRRHVHATAALAADRLLFQDNEIQFRTRNCLVKHHYFNDYALLILAVSQGRKRDKEEYFSEWAKTLDVRPDDGRTLQLLADDDLVPNTLLTHLCRIQSYVLLRMTTSCHTGEGQDRVFGAAPVYTQEEFGFPAPPAEEDLFERILNRMDSHPLMQSMIRIMDKEPADYVHA